MNIVSLAVLKIVLVSFLGVYLYRRKFISPDSLKFLTFFVIDISIPCLIFSRLIEGLSGVSIAQVIFFLFFSLLVFFAGVILGGLFSIKMPLVYRREFISGISFQNAGYLPLSLSFFLLSGQRLDDFLVYILLNLLGFNIILWSVGSFIIFRNKGQKFKLKSIFTPPVTSTLIALFMVYTGLANLAPKFLLSPMKMVGDTSFVLSMIILGSWLAQVDIKGLLKKIALVGWLSFVKLMVMPGVFLFFVVKFEVFSLLGLFIILQSAMPSAASLPIIVNLKGADSKFISQGVLMTHLLSIFTIPFWVAIFLNISGFYL